MSNPTDLLTAAITRAVRDAVKAELAPIIGRLEQADAAPATSPDDLLTTAQVAKLTGIAENTLRRWRSDNDDRGPEYVRMGRAVRYRRRDIEAWITDDAA